VAGSTGLHVTNSRKHDLKMVMIVMMMMVVMMIMMMMLIIIINYLDDFSYSQSSYRSKWYIVEVFRNKFDYITK